MTTHLRVVQCVAALTAVLSLAGCTSLFGGGYEFPKPGEPHATVRLSGSPSGVLVVRSFDEQGCYRGATNVPRDESQSIAQVSPGKELVMTYLQFTGAMTCQVTFVFTPEEHATYTIEPRNWSEPVKVLGVLDGERGVCGIVVHKSVGSEQRIEEVKQAFISEGLTCSTLTKVE